MVRGRNNRVGQKTLTTHFPDFQSQRNRLCVLNLVQQFKPNNRGLNRTLRPSYLII